MENWQSWRQRAKAHMRGRVTQEKVAERMGLTQGQIGHWLNGRRKINLDEFFVFCKIINADPRDILFGPLVHLMPNIKEMIEAEVQSAVTNRFTARRHHTQWHGKERRKDNLRS